MKAINLPSAFAVVSVLASSPANAAVTIRVQQVGADVVATGSGSANLTSLSRSGMNTNGGSVNPATGRLTVGSWGNYDLYQDLTGPKSFGTIGGNPADERTGNFFGVFGAGGYLAVPQNYVSGSALGTSTNTWQNATLTSLGLTAGTYTYTWGSGSTADSLTINIDSVAALPEPATWAMLLLGFGMIGAASRYRRKSVKVSLA